jgi:cytochrome bd ubiquinol oxidase subunit II
MTLPQLWFGAVAVLFVGYFVLEGFDFGVGMLFPILGRTENRRRVLLNTIGPVWDGNEVWLITAVGAMFAAFPDWYATLLAGMYLPMLLILVSLIVRVCAIEWRGKIDDPVWRSRCDAAIMFGSWVPAFVWGIVFANIVGGVALGADKRMTSGVFGLLGPYALLGGAAFALLFVLHGCVFVALKSGGEVRADAVKLAARLAVPAAGVCGVFVLWTQLANGRGWTWLLVGLVVALLAATMVLTNAEREGWAFVSTALAVIAMVAMLFVTLFPNVLPSTISDAFDLTIANASSSPYTLKILSWCAAFAAPVVLLYQGWTYWVFRQRISVDQIPPSIGLPARRPR